MTTELIPYASSTRLTDADKLRAIDIISRMLGSFAQRPPSQAGFVRAFVDNIEDLPLSVIERTADRFARGLIPDRNNEFPPSAAVFREVVTKEAQGDLIAARARQQIDETLKMIYAPKPPRTKESKARVAEMARAYLKANEADDWEKRIERFREQGKKADDEIRRRQREEGDVAGPGLRAVVKDWERLEDSLNQARKKEAAA